MESRDASVVLAPYLESLVRGRRVAVFGDGKGSLGPGLVERGARLVHVYDPVAERAAEAAASLRGVRGVTVAALPDGDLAVREGAFELVVVPDLSLFSPVHDVVVRARKLVGPNGHAMFVVPNPDRASSPSGPAGDIPSYYELYDAVALQFPLVRMLGQAPFLGYLIAEFAPDQDPDVVVDTSLMSEESAAPTFYVALGSHRPPSLDSYAIVQVPELAGAATADELVVLRDQVQSLEGRATKAAELETEVQRQQDVRRKAEARAGDSHVRAGRLESKIRDLEEELRRQRERGFRLSNELEEERKLRTKNELELSMIRKSPALPKKEDDDQRARIHALEQELRTSSERLEKLEAELAASRSRVVELDGTVIKLTDELGDARAAEGQDRSRVKELEAELRERTARTDELDAKIIELEQEAATRSQKAASKPQKESSSLSLLVEQMREEQERELTTYETALRDRARELTRVRADLAHCEGLVRELLLPREVQQEKDVVDASGQSMQALRAQLDGLAAQAASRETQLRQAQWRVEELEHKLELRESPPEPSTQVTQLEQALHAAQTELDALRRSLQQERQLREQIEAQSEAESALRHAQSELQNQAVLLNSVAAASDVDSDSG